MKKASSLGLILLMLVSVMILPTQASDVYQETEVIQTEFGNIEIEARMVVYDSLLRSNTKSASRIATVKYDGKAIADVTLSATFGYDGKTAWVTSASGSHTTYDGWSYSNEKITNSGGTASLSATLSHLLHKSAAVNVSLTCSPTGQIS